MFRLYVEVDNSEVESDRGSDEVDDVVSYGYDSAAEYTHTQCTAFFFLFSWTDVSIIIAILFIILIIVIIIIIIIIIIIDTIIIVS